MPFIQARCPHCSGFLAVDSEKDACICQLCGNPFIVEKAVENYNSLISGENSGSDFIIRNGILENYSGSSPEVMIPDSTEHIGKSAFKNRVDITAVFIPESVRSIGNYAFYGCIRLGAVFIPKSIRYIGESAFDGCIHLMSVEIPAGVSGQFRADIGRNAFAGCANLVSVTMHDRIKSVNPGIFDNCSEEIIFSWKYLSENTACSDVISERELMNRCIYCGGKLNGIFRKKCTECGIENK